jgi:hypothetical protein
MTISGPSGEPAADATPPNGSRRPRASARRGRIAAVAISAGAVVALTTVIALNDGSASGTPASGTAGNANTGSGQSNGDQGNGNQFRPANPSDDFGFGNNDFGDGSNDNSGSSSSNGGSSSSNGGSSNGGGFTPHTRSGGS